MSAPLTLTLSNETARVMGELSPEERLLWVGKSRGSGAITALLLLMILGIVGICLALFVVFLFASRAPPLAGPLFIAVLVAGAAIITAPLWAIGRSRKAVYAITDRRAIIMQLAPSGDLSIQSLTAGELGQLSRMERRDGSESLMFQQDDDGDEGMPVDTVGFVDIDRVQDVEAILRAALPASPPHRSA